jgi:hypothetical protein
MYVPFGAKLAFLSGLSATRASMLIDNLQAQFLRKLSITPMVAVQ